MTYLIILGNVNVYYEKIQSGKIIFFFNYILCYRTTIRFDFPSHVFGLCRHCYMLLRYIGRLVTRQQKKSHSSLYSCLAFGFIFIQVQNPQILVFCVYVKS